jgi:hypothetical protein
MTLHTVRHAAEFPAFVIGAFFVRNAAVLIVLSVTGLIALAIG